MKLPVFKSTEAIPRHQRFAGLWECEGWGEGKESRASRLEGFTLDNENQNQYPHSTDYHE